MEDFETLVASNLGPLRWDKIVPLLITQAGLLVLAAGAAEALHGDLKFVFGVGYETPTFDTLRLGALATLPLLGTVALEEAFDLPKKWPAFEAMGNFTKATCLIAMGSERAPMSVTIWGVALLVISFSIIIFETTSLALQRTFVPYCRAHVVSRYLARSRTA
jgi:hypothetical protein